MNILFACVLILRGKERRCVCTRLTATTCGLVPEAEGAAAAAEDAGEDAEVEPNAEAEAEAADGEVLMTRSGCICTGEAEGEGEAGRCTIAAAGESWEWAGRREAESFAGLKNTSKLSSHKPTNMRREMSHDTQK
jgi:hypothetical protein